MEESSLLIQEYYKSTAYAQLLQEYSARASIGNAICGDSITVTVLIGNNKIIGYGYGGSPSLITAAAAAFLGDMAIGEKIDDILTRNADWVTQQ